MALSYNDTLRNNVMNQMRNYISGTLTIYPGTRPIDPSFPTAELPLVQFTLAYNAAVSGRITLSNAPVAAEVQHSGTATWFRVLYSAYSSGFDGNVSVAGGDGDLILSNTALVAHDFVALKKMDLYLPNPS